MFDEDVVTAEFGEDGFAFAQLGQDARGEAESLFGLGFFALRLNNTLGRATFFHDLELEPEKEFVSRQKKEKSNVHLVQLSVELLRRTALSQLDNLWVEKCKGRSAILQSTKAPFLHSDEEGARIKIVEKAHREAVSGGYFSDLDWDPRIAIIHGKEHRVSNVHIIPQL